MTEAANYKAENGPAPLVLGLWRLSVTVWAVHVRGARWHTGVRIGGCLSRVGVRGCGLAVSTGGVRF